ncbi:MAG TPA: response regulator [Candidatus Binatia bacterium]|nr:response regulator [Candidatus Binatia bacterium]
MPRRPAAPILVVEDNAETRDALRMVLEDEGYAAATAANGKQALDYLRHRGPVTMVLLDLRMPVMDGWALCRALQADPALAEIPVVALSEHLDGDVPGTVATVRKATLDPPLFLSLIERVALQGTTRSRLESN